jgi:hypothetical protein
VRLHEAVFGLLNIVLGVLAYFAAMELTKVFEPRTRWLLNGVLISIIAMSVIATTFGIIARRRVAE